MTAPATTRRAGPFNGNGTTTEFPFEFKVFSTSDLAVMLTRTDGIESTLVLDSDYSVEMNADQEDSPGGTITYPISGDALAAGEKLTAIGALPYDQTTDLPTGGNYRAQVVETALDRTVMQVQQVAEELSRALTLPPSAAGADTELPAPEANKVIAWNSTGTGLVNVDAADLATSVISGTGYTDVFDGTGAQTEFVLSANPGSVNALDVAIGGVSQVNGVDFTVSGTTLTFTSAPSAGTGNVAVRYVVALPAGTVGAGDVTYLPPYTGATPATGAEKFGEQLSVADFGAVGDGSTDDTDAIQAAFNALVNFAGPGRLIFPRTTSFYRITSAIVLPAGFARNTIDLQGSEIRYDGVVSSSAAVFSMTGNQIYFNSFENGMINANSKAGYCIYAVGAGWQYAIKANKVVNCELRYPTVVSVQIGDQTNTGNDQDGADWLFLKTYFRAVTPALTGAILDGDNVFNTNFSHCFFNTNSGVTAAGHIRVLRAGSTYVYDAFFGNIDSSAYCIDHRSGILGVYGANSEEGSILKTQDMVEERKSIVLAGIMVNESTASATPEYSVYAPVGQITMSGCTFGKGTARARKVYAGDSLHADNIYLGSDSAGDGWGTYELDYPDRCSIEGQHLNGFRPLNGNPCFHLWPGTAAGDAPVGYTLTGSGTVAVQRSTTSAVQGPYTARLIVTTGYATGNVIDGLQTTVPIAQNTKTGRRSITVVARGSVTGLTGATTLKLRVNMVDSAGSVVGSNVVSMTPSSGNFTGFCSVVASDPTVVAVVAMVGIGTAGASGTIYLDNVYVVPVEAYTVHGGYHYKSYVDAWTKQVPPMDGMLDWLKAGQLRAGPASAANKITWGTAAPTVGDHRAGDVVFNSAGSTGNPAGWMCTVAGTPGTWKPMANLA